MTDARTAGRREGWPYRHERCWRARHVTPAERHHYFVDLGVLSFVMHYVADAEPALTVVDGDGVLPDGHTETVTTTVAEVRPHLYLTSRHERRGTRVLHLEDFERGRVHSRRAVAARRPPASGPSRSCAEPAGLRPRRHGAGVAPACQTQVTRS